MIISNLLNLGSKTLKVSKVRTHQLDSEIILSSLLKKKSKQRAFSIYLKKKRILE
jgi:hypothetical protein